MLPPSPFFFFFLNALPHPNLLVKPSKSPGRPRQRLGSCRSCKRLLPGAIATGVSKPTRPYQVTACSRGVPRLVPQRLEAARTHSSRWCPRQRALLARGAVLGPPARSLHCPGQRWQLWDARNICFYGISAALPQTNVNITGVNKCDPKIHVQLYVTGEKEGGRRNTPINP